MSRRVGALIGVAVVVVGAAGLTGLLAANADDAVQSEPRAARSGFCPDKPLPLPTNALGAAADAALLEEPPEGEPRAISAVFARVAKARFVKKHCGKETYRRTVFVTIDRRAFHPAASASYGAHFVSRLADGYRAWYQWH